MMTSLMIHLPDELAELFEDTGILKSPETIEMLKNMAMKARQQQMLPKYTVFEALAAPEIEGLADINFEVPKLSIGLKPAEFN